MRTRRNKLKASGGCQPTESFSIKAAAKADDELFAFSADITINAADGEKKGPRAFTINAYNGGALELPNFDLPVVVDLKGMSVAKSVIANLNHERTQIVGHATDKVNDGKTLALNGVVSGAGQAAAEVLASHDNGFPWQASIEAKPLKLVRVPAGKSVDVNGQSFQGPILVARKSRLHGIAFVPHGADDSTSVKIAASAAHSKENDMDKFQKWIEAMDLDFAELTDKQKAHLKAKFDAEINASANGGRQPTGGSKEDASDDEIEAEQFDLGEIKAAYNDLVTDLDMKIAEHEDDITDRKKLTEIKASARKSAAELKKNAIKGKWSATKFEVESIRAASAVEVDLIRAERPSGPAIHAGTRDLSTAIIEAAMCQTLRVPDFEKQYDEKTLEAANKMFHGRIGLKQMLIMAASANGMSFAPFESVTTANLKAVLRKAFPTDADHDIEGAFSTLSLPTAFSNVGNKELLAGWNLGPQYQVWREIAIIRTSTDFKPTTSVRLLDDFEYEALGPNGEIASGKVGEETYTRSVDTVAKLFSLTRKNIINDDVGCLQDLRTKLGSGFSRKFTKLFWTTFLANSTFFTAARANYIVGATTTLLSDAVGLQLGIDSFKQLKTADGKRAGGTASILLHPPELNSAAVKLYTPVAAIKASEVNIYANRYRPVEVDWLSDSTIANYSATAWYLLQDPALLAAVVVSFLNGQENPTVESAEADFDTLGITFRGYGDVGVDLAEYLAGIKSKGAA